MTKTYRTRNNSTFEVDEENCRARRINLTTPYERLPDGEWRTYVAFHWMGNSLWFQWDEQGTGTLTSEVLS